jgi:hypothetical protein
MNNVFGMPQSHSTEQVKERLRTEEAKSVQIKEQVEVVPSESI